MEEFILKNQEMANMDIHEVEVSGESLGNKLSDKELMQEV